MKRQLLGALGALLLVRGFAPRPTPSGFRASRRFADAFAAALLLGLVASLPAGCSSSSTKAEKACSAGKAVFCRCRDRQEGQKICDESGEGYGPCEPCESDDNPEEPLDPGEEPTPLEDGGTKPSTKCGDGVVQAGEDCDDKNASDDDGCSASCRLSGATAAASVSCPGLEVHVWGGDHRPSLVATTEAGGVHSTATGISACATGSVANDRVFKVVAHKSGQLGVTTSDTTFNNYLYAAASCQNGEIAHLACINANAGGGGESLKLPVESGKTYHVFVDGSGAQNNGGAFKVTFAID